MRLRNLCKKENFKLEIKPIIETLLDELYELESEHEKGAKQHVNIIMELDCKKCSKTYFHVLGRQYENSELYADDKKPKYSSNPTDIFKSTKNIYETLYTKGQPPELIVLKFLAKFLTGKSLQ